MEHAKKVRRSRRSAAVGPDAKACVPAASRILHTTVTPEQMGAACLATDTIGFDLPATAAEILLGAAMWLVQERDLLGEELTLAQGAAEPTGTVPFALADLQRLHLGLSRAIALIDGLSIDPTKVRRGCPVQPATSRQVLQ